MENSMVLAVLVAQLCLTPCDPMYCSLPGSSVHEILQARILKWVAIPFSRGSFWPRDWMGVSCIAGRFFTIWATREAHEHGRNPLPHLLKLNVATLLRPMEWEQWCALLLGGNFEGPMGTYPCLDNPENAMLAITTTMKNRDRASIIQRGPL